MTPRNHLLHVYIRRTLHLFNCLIILSVVGCSVSPLIEKEEPGYIFFPALPDAPRIQYLTTFSSSKDVNKPSSGFDRFILGKDDAEDAIYINKPYGVAINDGKIYAVDTRGNGYAVMDLVKQEFHFVRGDGGGRMAKPINITFDTDGSKYITDTKLNKVLVFDKNDHFLRALGEQDQFKPTDTAISGDKLFVSDLKDHEIEVLNKNTGVRLYKIGKAGSKTGELYDPTNIKIGPNNHLYVSETTNFRVQEFTLEGRYVQTFGSVGTNIGKLARPKGIALDNNERLYIVDAAFENIQVMDPQGKLLMYFGSPGSNPDNINLPADIAIDYKNVKLFQHYAHPDFKLEYIILVSSQFGINKINVFGYGKMKGFDYQDDTQDDMQDDTQNDDTQNDTTESSDKKSSTKN